jgi:hypothetical protein
MKISTLRKTLPAFTVMCTLALTASPGFSQGKVKANVKVKESVETKVKHGRQEGELPYGLEQHTEKKGSLPSGLQKKKDEERSLTRGLEQGGKRLKTTDKATKNIKR